MLAEPLEVRLFKRPGQMIDAIKAEKPDVVGLSHYVWNANLNALVFDIAKNLLKTRPGSITRRDQIVAREEPRWAEFFFGEFCELGAGRFVQPQLAVAAQAIEPMQFKMLVETRHAEKLLKRALAHFRDMDEAHVIGHERYDLLGHFAGIP